MMFAKCYSEMCHTTMFEFISAPIKLTVCQLFLQHYMIFKRVVLKGCNHMLMGYPHRFCCECHATMEQKFVQ